MGVLRSAAKQVIRCLPESVARGLLRSGVRAIPRAEGAFLAAAHHVRYTRPHVATTAGGFAMELHLSDKIDRRIYYTGHYERPTEEVMRRLLPGARCFVDIGANNGFFAILATTLMGEGGRVFAFEPFTATYQRLQRNIAVSGAKGITPVQVALSNVTERRQMYCGTATLGMTSFAGGECGGLGDSSDDDARDHAGNEERQGDESVECDTFDNVWARCGGGPIEFVKMDIEGAELLVLEGMTDTLGARLFKHLFVEVHPRQIRTLGGEPRRVAGLLIEHGYRLFERRDGRLADVDVEAFFASNVGHRFILATQDESLRGLAVPEGF